MGSRQKRKANLIIPWATKVHRLENSYTAYLQVWADIKQTPGLDRELLAHLEARTKEITDELVDARIALEEARNSPMRYADE